MLTYKNKDAGKTIDFTLLQRFNAEGEEFLAEIVTGDETCVHCFEPDSKRQSMEWHYIMSLTKKNAKQCVHHGRLCDSVLGCEGCNSGCFLEQATPCFISQLCFRSNFFTVTNPSSTVESPYTFFSLS
ncbi:hypothetical protein PR048_005550 [Dryococelus australis]|uniref:Uncharacterized protein n=1 Tax=Dryococelus australis TaxID=614101 RepID=A0ABQ9I8I7_9NEOP|nr:hypothetical protein PR048_005550 [Dryococelus australis]